MEGIYYNTSDTNEVRGDLVDNCRDRIRGMAQEGKRPDEIVETFGGITDTERDILYLVASAEVHRAEEYVR